MAHMVAKLKRYAQLAYLFTKEDFFIQSAYPLNFFFATISKVLRVVLVMFFFQTLVLRVPNIPQWSTVQLYILAATFYTTDLVASVLFHRNLLYHLPRAIQEGSFDQLLTRPIPTLVYTAFQRIDVGDFMAVLPLMYFWVYIGGHFVLPITAVTVAMYILLVVTAIVFIFSLVLLFGSTAFWFTRGDGFGRVIDNATGAAKFPFDVFPKKFQFVVFYCVPLALLATLPTHALLGIADWWTVVYSMLFTAVLFCVALAVWKKGLHVYQSSSS